MHRGAVYLVDANLLLYAHFEAYPQHIRTKQWLDGLLNGSNRVGLPWQAILSFVRLGTNRQILPAPQTVAGAWGQVRAWLSCDVCWIPLPTEHHIDVLERLLLTSGMKSSLVSDASLAALAQEHGLIVCSNDSDFARFPGLRWLGPLTS